MFYCKVENGMVVNRAVFDAEMPEDWPDREAWVQNDAAQIGWSHDGEEFIAPPAPEEPLPTVEMYQNAIQATVDAAAQSKQFNDGVTLASYKDSTNPIWAAQATAFIAWRDQVWAYSYAQLAEVEAGQREQPSIADFIVELPAIEWSAEGAQG